jgi:phasin family protein
MTTKTSAPKSKPAAKRAPATAKVPAKAAPAATAEALTIDSAPALPAAEVVVETAVASAPEPDVVAPAPAKARFTPEPADEPTDVAAVTPITSTSPSFVSARKEPIMATKFESTQDAVRNSVSQLSSQAEAAMSNGKAAMEQVTAKSKEAVEASMKSMDEMTEVTRANVDALMVSAKAATAGVEQLMAHLTEASKKSFEETSAMVKTLTSAKTPNDLMQLQSDFAKTQFDEAVAQYSKMTEMMVKLAGEVMEPMQNQMAIATDKLKAAWTAK